MNLANVPAGLTIFMDANILLFALTNHPQHGPACEAFLDRVENREIGAVTSTHVLGEVVHRIMTIEACDRFGWPVQGIANRLRRHPTEVQQLIRPRQALDEINAAHVIAFGIAPAHVSLATDLSRQTGLLYGDALIVAMMRDQGYVTAAIAQVAHHKIPENIPRDERKQWLTWTEETRRAALELAEEIKARNPRTVRDRSRKLNDTCANCHSIWIE